MGVGAVAAVLAALLLASPARAGTYTVETCANGSLSGWSHFYSGSYSSWGQSCGTFGGGLAAVASAAANASAGWTFTAPADTEIAAFNLWRSYSLPANRAFGTGVVTTLTSGSGRGYYDYRPNFGAAGAVGPELEADAGLRGQTALTVQVDCGGGAACTGSSQLTVFSAAFELRDDVAPAFGTVSGSLLATGALKGTRAVSYAATDRGGGIRRAQLLVDGASLAVHEPGCSFALAVPCPLGASGSLTVDTTRLADGEHDVELRIADATLTNHVVYGPVAIAVDNVPPPVATSAPRIHGSPTLYADDGTWAGAGLTFARRWQRYEHGAWEDIAGAGGSEYTPSGEDAGHRLRFRVRATSAEGTTDAYSDPTAPLPFPGPTPTPTPVATPTPPPTAAPAIPAPAAVTAPSTIVMTAPKPDTIGIPTAAFRSTGRSVITLRWGERRQVTGTLRRPDGRPLAGAAIAISSRVRALDARRIPLGQVTTDSAGRFTYLPAAGVSRSIAFRYGRRTATVSISVVPRVIVRFKRTGRIEGRVSGAPAGLRKVVDLQALHGGTWRTFATTRLQPTGGRFAASPSRPPRRIRALVRADPGWPFLTGASAPAARPR